MEAQIPETPQETVSTDFPSTSKFPDELVLSEVVEALENGKSESFIIQDLLLMKGRKYADGKQLLNEIKEVLRSEG